MLSKEAYMVIKSLNGQNALAAGQPSFAFQPLQQSRSLRMNRVTAGRAGFEPATELPRHSLSRRAHSATLAPPQENKLSNVLLLMAEGVGFEPTWV